VRYDPIDNIILFGGSLTIVGLADWLKNESIEVKIYTSKRHSVERLTQEKNLEELINEIGVPYVITEDINIEDSLINEITPNTVGIGIGEAWSFNSEIIDAFKGKLLDFMGIPLPRYRGGAHYTWMILANEKNNGMRLQVINEDMVQGVFDSGEIVDSIDYQMKKTDVKPSNYFAREVTESIDFIKSFLVEAREGKDFELKIIDESESLYLPRLYTDIHAWIDWRRWNADEIDRFIRAFDDPYMGARTTLGDKSVRLKDAELVSDSTNYHPFQSGLIVRKYNNQAMICCSGGIITVSKIIDDHGNDILSSIEIGDRFFTPEDAIEKALNYSAVYDSTGLKD
tara:strand:- start:919 stop:1941 length:1023 start_codon:yes stop_codon:yes gene_type:complete